MVCVYKLIFLVVLLLNFHLYSVSSYSEHIYITHIYFSQTTSDLSVLVYLGAFMVATSQVLNLEGSVKVAQPYKKNETTSFLKPQPSFSGANTSSVT